MVVVVVVVVVVTVLALGFRLSPSLHLGLGQAAASRSHQAAVPAVSAAVAEAHAEVEEGRRRQPPAVCVESLRCTAWRTPAQYTAVLEATRSRPSAGSGATTGKLSCRCVAMTSAARIEGDVIVQIIFDQVDRKRLAIQVFPMPFRQPLKRLVRRRRSRRNRTTGPQCSGWRGSNFIRCPALCYLVVKCLSSSAAGNVHIGCNRINHCSARLFRVTMSNHYSNWRVGRARARCILQSPAARRGR